MKEIKPHDKAFLSTFVDKKPDHAIIKYGSKEVKVKLNGVSDLKAQAYRNRTKIVKAMGVNFPLMSLSAVIEYLYGKTINKGMWSRW